MKYVCMRVSMYDVQGQHNYEIYVYVCLCMMYKGSTNMKYMCMRVSMYDVQGQHKYEIYVYACVCLCMYALCCKAGLQGPVEMHNRCGVWGGMSRVGQDHIYSPHLTVYVVISCQKIPYAHRIYIWFCPTLGMSELVHMTIHVLALSCGFKFDSYWHIYLLGSKFSSEMQYMTASLWLLPCGFYPVALHYTFLTYGVWRCIMFKVGQNHIYIHGVYTVIFAEISWNIRSYTAYNYIQFWPTLFMFWTGMLLCTVTFWIALPLPWYTLPNRFGGSSTDIALHAFFWLQDGVQGLHAGMRVVLRGP